MQALSRVLAVLVLLAGVVAPAMAESSSCGCPLQAAMQKLPSLVFAVDGETTSCDKHAATLAKNSDASMKYVVQQLFDSKADAQAALISKTEDMLASFTTASTCEHSGTTTIAGQKMSCAKSAAKLADAVEEATKLVQVSYRVGAEECNCPSKAKQLAKNSDEKVTFVVNGEETCCPTTNKLNIARAKYQAALQTVSATTEAVSQSGSPCKGCPVEAGMSSLPEMAFVVGGEATSCDKHAASLAESSDAKIQFAVRQSFDNKQQAMQVMVAMTEAMVNDFATPSTCEKSGTTTVAGQKLHCSKTAAKLASDVREAMQTVNVSYEVDGKTCHCPNEATSVAKSTGAEKLFVVNGEKTSCELTSRLNLARAKYRAAIETLAKQASAVEKDAA